MFGHRFLEQPKNANDVSVTKLVPFKPDAEPLPIPSQTMWCPMTIRFFCRKALRQGTLAGAAACIGLSAAPLLMAAPPYGSAPVSKSRGDWVLKVSSQGDLKPDRSQPENGKPGDAKAGSQKPSNGKPAVAEPPGGTAKPLDLSMEPPASQADPAGIGASSNVIPEGEEQIIDLTTALRLAETANPQIAISRQGIQTALAEQLGAKALALPHLRAGMNYHLHNGVLQTSFGLMRKVNSRSFYIGGGSGTLAAETLVFPMVQINTHLGEAIYQPLAARQHVYASQYETRATINEVFLEVASRYLELMAAEAELKAIQQSEEELGEIARLTASYAQAGQGRLADARRARTEALLTRLEEERAQERVAVASADLSRVLHLDPSVRLRTPGGAIAPVDLIDPNEQLPALIEIAQRVRPELASRLMEISRRDYEYLQAKTRPLFPEVQVRFSAGGFGGGTNRYDLVSVSPGFGPIFGRTDFDIIMFWQLDNMGVGNIAKTREKRSEREIATLEWHNEQATIRDEVVTAYGRMEQTFEAMRIAERRLGDAERGLQEDLQRIRGGVGLPVEVLDSMKLLIEARNALILATVDYDVAQFELYVAIGQTPVGNQATEPATGKPAGGMNAPTPAPAPENNP